MLVLTAGNWNLTCAAQHARRAPIGCRHEGWLCSPLSSPSDGHFTQASGVNLALGGRRKTTTKLAPHKSIQNVFHVGAEPSLVSYDMTKQTVRLYNPILTLCSWPPCRPRRISPSLATTTTRRGLPPVLDTPRNISNSHGIHASIHPLPLGGSALCSSCSSFPCSGCTFPSAHRCRRQQSRRSYMPRGVCIAKSFHPSCSLSIP